ncbi:hypothetical protein EON81_01455 [bacterium]|nr:MAG: hypothetical protein EON81_01455 [bacterium]
MSYLAADHDLAPESVRFASALYASSTSRPETDERSLARFALGLCDAEEQTLVLRALIASGAMRERLLAIRAECRRSSIVAPSVSVREALHEAAARASAFFGSVGEISTSESRLFRRALTNVARTIRAGQLQQIAFVRGEAGAPSGPRIPGMERSLSVEMDGDDLLASARFSAAASEGRRLTLTLADPAGGRVALVAEPVRNGIWEARVEGFALASGLGSDEITPDLFRLVAPQIEEPTETVSRLPVIVKENGEAIVSEIADIRAHGPIQFQSERITVTLSASQSTRERYSDGILELSLPLGTLDLPLGAWPLSDWSDAPRDLTVALPGAVDGNLVCGSFLMVAIVSASG